jgi:hypothetical protein
LSCITYYKAYIISTITSGEASGPTGKTTGIPDEDGDVLIQDNNQYRKKSSEKPHVKNPGKTIPGAPHP